MNRSLSVALVLGGMILGCGATAVAPIAKGWAQAPAGRWACYVVDQFPDLEEARSWEGAANITAGLNRVAPNTPAGTVLALTPKTHGSGSYASVACVKN
jgi:hypothetical protein